MHYSPRSLQRAFCIATALAGLVTTAAARKISTDGRCGWEVDATCLGSVNGDCCSLFGHCGNTSSYCGIGCQTSFGSCTPVFPWDGADPLSAAPSPSSAALQVSQNGRCGWGTGYTCLGSPEGDCCNLYGFCGSNNNHCLKGRGCQSKYGLCAGDPSLSASSLSSTSSAISSAAGSSSISSAISSSIASSSSDMSLSSSVMPSSISSDVSSSTDSSSTSSALSDVSSTTASSSATASVSSAPLIINGDFELGIDPWAVNVNATLNSELIKGVLQCVQALGTCISGQNYYGISTILDLYFSVSLSQTLNLVPGNMYTVSCLSSGIGAFVATYGAVELWSVITLLSLGPQTKTFQAVEGGVLTLTISSSLATIFALDNVTVVAV